MTNLEKQEILEEIEIEKLWIKDLEKIWQSYAKKAFEAKTEREKKQAKKGFLEYETMEELIEAYAWADIDLETYRTGTEYFESLKEPPKLSTIEAYRNQIRAKINNHKGSLETLEELIEPTVKAPVENAFEKREREERAERFQQLEYNDIMRKKEII